jgi:hypothetical protein
MSRKFTFESLDLFGSLERRLSMSGLTLCHTAVQVVDDDPSLPVPDDDPITPEPDPGPLPPSDPPIILPPLPPSGPVGPG